MSCEIILEILEDRVYDAKKANICKAEISRIRVSIAFPSCLHSKSVVREVFLLFEGEEGNLFGSLLQLSLV